MGASFSLRPSSYHANNIHPPSGMLVTPECPRVTQRGCPMHSNYAEVAKLTHKNSQLMVINDKPSQMVITSPAPLPTTLNSPVPLFALIIGINEYTHCRNLQGAVADAKAMKGYLEEVLCVSEDHIHTLFDAHATRDAIIKAFDDLRNDERIKQGDPILIFYAGHGGELPAPPVWGTQNKIQCLLPRDYRPNSIHPIPDRTIGALLDGISRVKGDNITVIFDCCHSASGTRPQYEELVPRSVNLDCSIPPDLDRDIWRSRAGAVADGFSHHSLRSHVLMAACGEKELAYEHDGRGQFTGALLRALKGRAANNLTYAQVLQYIHLPRQTPHCEGFNQHRPLFNGRMIADRRVRHSVRADNGRTRVIGAGLAHGVTSGVEFTLYDDRGSRLGVVIVDNSSVVENFRTILTPSEHLAGASFAKLTRVGKVPLCLAPEGNRYPVLEDTLRQIGRTGDTNSPNFRRVDGVEEARLQVLMEGELAVFRIFDERVNKFGLTKLPRMASLDNLAHILNAAAHYYWYLDLTNKSPGAVYDVAVDFYLLKWEYDDYGLPLYVPVEPGYCQKDPNSHGSDVIDFVVDPNAVYGLKITNNSPWDLYLNAFLFNTSSLSIAAYYTQTSAGNPHAPLKRNEAFTIGYGPGGTAPFSYWIEGSQDVDVGYLKIFFATRPIDMSDVVQKSPFTTRMNGRGWTPSYGDDARKAKLSVSPKKLAPSAPADTWFTVEIPVVQRRRATSAGF